jgi:hypothetical protein
MKLLVKVREFESEARTETATSMVWSRKRATAPRAMREMRRPQPGSVKGSAERSS